MNTHSDFESFWKKFLADHPSAANRWAHVAALLTGTAGLALALRRRSAFPLLFGTAAAVALAIGGHPVFQGDRPKNLGRPLWAGRAFLRLCVRTITGRADQELAAIHAEAAARADGRGSTAAEN